MSYEMSKKCFHSVVCYPQRAQGPENILRLSDSTQISLSRLTRQSYEIYISTVGSTSKPNPGQFQ